ncbi:MAG: ABC transporter ATP-binding protein [Deltaproteobacteria bacterium]|nr:ABC transporter ATP-binding protein [Deltaproteobacteria bacterium]MCL5792121.1 ABC transporter ATP-binding protein [Deltaproteobacteria bacterium]
MKIDIKSLKKSFGSHIVLDGIDLTIEDGKTTVIIGQTGCGKSVLIKHIIGLLKPDDGQILIDGVEFTNMKGKEFSNIIKNFGVLFQNAALFDSMTTGENVAFPLIEHTKLSKKEIDKKVEEKLAIVGLKGVEQLYPSELSGGMKKRVGLARAIALDPKMLIFDEPTTGLDPVMSDTIDNLIVDTQKHLGVTSIVISHDIQGTFKIAHRIAMLYKGKVVLYGSPDDFKNTENPIVRQFLERRAEGPLQVEV